MRIHRAFLAFILAALVLLFLGRGALGAEQAAGVAEQAAGAAGQAAGGSALPAAAGFVNDYAGVLPADDRGRLEASLRSLERDTGVEMAVAVVPRAAPDTPKMYAVKLFQAWGVGKKGKDNGILFLVAMEERRVEVEVGYGLEGVLPDGLVGEILDREVVPRFRAGDFAQGIAGGVAALAARVREAEAGGGATPRAPAPAPARTSPFTLLFYAAVVLAAVLLAAEVLGLRGRARRCPRCRGRLSLDDEVLRDATAVMPGEGRRVVRCPRCGYRAEELYTIPWIEPGGHGGFGWGGRYGGWRRGGGGGFGGFGGGRSGGGGAGRGW